MKRVPMVLLLASSLSPLVACGGGGGGGSVPPGGGPATHFSVDAPANIPSAISFKLTVTALDASNNPVTSYSGTVHFTTTDAHARIPGDSTLVSGSKTLSTLLTSAGGQTITATDVASASITGSSNSINVSALADAFPVETFGAKGDGHTDDTAAIQAAKRCSGGWRRLGSVYGRSLLHRRNAPSARRCGFVRKHRSDFHLSVSERPVDFVQQLWRIGSDDSEGRSHEAPAAKSARCLAADALQQCPGSRAR